MSFTPRRSVDEKSLANLPPSLRELHRPPSSTSGFHSLAEYAGREGLAGNRPTEMGGLTNPDSENKLLLLRELDKQRIRVELLAEELDRWQKWEDEAAMRSDPYQITRLASPILNTELGSRFQEALPFQRNFMIRTPVSNGKSPDRCTSSGAKNETIALKLKALGKSKEEQPTSGSAPASPGARSKRGREIEEKKRDNGGTERKAGQLTSGSVPASPGAGRKRSREIEEKKRDNGRRESKAEQPTSGSLPASPGSNSRRETEEKIRDNGKEKNVMTKQKLGTSSPKLMSNLKAEHEENKVLLRSHIDGSSQKRSNFCDECGVVPGAKNMNSHNNGKKHLAKLQDLGDNIPQAPRYTWRREITEYGGKLRDDGQRERKRRGTGNVWKRELSK